jgi:L-seryl-tRNA(Ser) seleniumtransferase
MSRPEFLSQLPSLEELLEHPRIAKTIDRVNRSTAVVQLRGAMHSLGAEIARRTEGLPSLAPSELLDRLIRQLEFPRPTSTASCVNATGEFFLAPTLRPPIASAAIQAARIAADGFRNGPFQSAAPIAAKLVGAERGKVLNSRPQAIATAIEALAAGRLCVVARGDMTELAPGVRIDAVVRRAGATLREVGAADAASADDFRAALQDLSSQGAGSVCVLVRQSVLGSSDKGLLAQVVGVAHQAGATVVIDGGGARLRRDTPAYGDKTPCVEELVASGADVVVFDAAGLVGGPVAGVAVGKQSAIERLDASLAAKIDAIDPAVDAALGATLRLFEKPGDLRFTHPLHQLLDAPVDNLRTRAERLAARIAAVEGIATAAAYERPSGPRGGATWAIRVEPTGGDADALRSRLAAGDPAVLGGMADSAVILDLSTVFPGQDSALVAAIGTERPGNPQASGDPEPGDTAAQADG